MASRRKAYDLETPTACRFVACHPALFSDAEGGEDAVKDVIGGGFSGQAVQLPQRCVEIEQQHFVRDPGADGGPRGGE